MSALREEGSARTARPLRRAALAGVAALLIGALLWLAGGDEEAPAPAAVEVPVAVPAAPPAPAPVVETPALPPLEVHEVVEVPVALAGGAGAHVLQLGVFGARENAERLQARLRSAGFEARLETRVVLGPFAERSEAEAQQAALRAAGEGVGIVVTPRAP